MARLRILFLTRHMPQPTSAGRNRREYELVRRLHRSADVYLLVVSARPDADRAAARALTSSECAAAVVLEAVWDDHPGISAIEARSGCPEAADTIVRLTQEIGFDVLHVAGFELMRHIPDGDSVPVVLDEPVVEYLAAQERIVHEHDLSKLERLASDAGLTRVREQAAWRRAALCAAAAPDCAAVLEQSIGVVARVPDAGAHADPETWDEAAAALDAAYEAVVGV